MELSFEVGQPIVIGRYIAGGFAERFTGADNQSEASCFVIRDFSEGSCLMGGSIPSTTSMVIEARTRVAGMSKGGVDDMGIRNTVHQLISADSDNALLFGLDAIVGCAIKRDQIVKVSLVAGQLS